MTYRQRARADGGFDVTLYSDWPGCKNEWVSPNTHGIIPVRKHGEHGWIFKNMRDYCKTHKTEARKWKVADLPPGTRRLGQVHGRGVRRGGHQVIRWVQVRR